MGGRGGSFLVLYIPLDDGKLKWKCIDNITTSLLAVLRQLRLTGLNLWNMKIFTSQKTGIVSLPFTYCTFESRVAPFWPFSSPWQFANFLKNSRYIQYMGDLSKIVVPEMIIWLYVCVYTYIYISYIHILQVSVCLNTSINIPGIYHMVYTQIQVDIHHHFCFYNF